MSIRRDEGVRPSRFSRSRLLRPVGCVGLTVLAAGGERLLGRSGPVEAIPTGSLSSCVVVVMVDAGADNAISGREWVNGAVSRLMGEAADVSAGVGCTRGPVAVGLTLAFGLSAVVPSFAVVRFRFLVAAGGLGRLALVEVLVVTPRVSSMVLMSFHTLAHTAELSRRSLCASRSSFRMKRMSPLSISTFRVCPYIATKTATATNSTGANVFVVV